MKRLDKKVAIVTGGAGGIGAATAQLFCEEGARVVSVDLELAALAAARDAIRACVPEAETHEVSADLGNEEAAAQVVAETLRRFGRVDVLVNNAGIRSYEPLSEAKRETWE